MVSTIKLPKSKGPSVISQIIAIEVKGKARVSIKKRPYINSLVSGIIRYKYPERVYTLAIDTEDLKFLIIERLR